MTSKPHIHVGARADSLCILSCEGKGRTAWSPRQAETTGEGEMAHECVCSSFCYTQKSRIKVQ